MLVSLVPGGEKHMVSLQKIKVHIVLILVWVQMSWAQAPGANIRAFNIAKVCTF